MAATHHLVALPYPGRGHVNPMMSLCEHLLARPGVRLLLTVVVTEEWLGLLGGGGGAPAATGIRFRTIPNVIPSERHRGGDFVGFLEAVRTRMEAPFEELLGKLREEEEEEGDQGVPAVGGIIYDTYLPWAVAVGNRRGIPVCSFFTMSACFFSLIRHLQLVQSHGQPPHLALSEEDEDEEESLDFIPGVASLKRADIHSVRSLEKPLEVAFDSLAQANKARCLLLTTFYELEPRTVDALRAELRCPVYTVGPSIPYQALGETAAARGDDLRHAGYYDAWLGSRPRGSVLYVSLGSFLPVTAEQMEEMAAGLRDSGVRFLWVVRRERPRLEEMVGGAGLVVEWCDQLKVLCHPSVGGFLTHCGWNSTLEAVYAGVPMLTFPIFWDQPPDSRLVVDEWRIGLSLRRDLVGGGVVGREEIARAVRMLMGLEGEESTEPRRRASELGEACRRATRPGGSSAVGLDAFIADALGGSGD